MTGYPDVPDLVRKTRDLAAERGFGKSCADEVGRLLRTLAAAARGDVLEIGTGFGVGTAWLLAGLAPEATLTSVDSDPALIAGVRAVLGNREDLRLVAGDWRKGLEHGPFSLVFVDAAGAKDDGVEAVISVLRPGGIVVLDDFAPGPLFRGQPDGRWAAWMHNPGLLVSEVLVSPDQAVLVGARPS